MLRRRTAKPTSRRSEQLEQNASADEPADTSEATDATELKIDRIDIVDTKAELLTASAGQSTEIGIERITLTGLNGTPEQISDQILSQVLARVQDAAMDAIADQARKAIEEQAKSKLGDLKSKLFEKK